MDPNARPYSDDAEIQREYERITLSFRAIGGGLWDYDIETDALFCDDRWYAIMGLDPVEDQVRNVEEFVAHLHPEDAAIIVPVDKAAFAVLMERREPYREDYRIVRRDGAVRWIRSVASIVRDRTSRHMRAVGCVLDVTEFREAAMPGSAPPISTDFMVRLAAERAEGLQSGAISPLTGKERACLLWVSVGKTAWETATILGVSRRTVEFHLANATRKLDAGNKVHAAFIALRANLLNDR